MRISSLPILVTAVFALSGCAGMTDTQQRTLSGAGRLGDLAAAEAQA